MFFEGLKEAFHKFSIQKESDKDEKSHPEKNRFFHTRKVIFVLNMKKKTTRKPLF